MSEFLERKKKALEDAENAYGVLEESLQELPYEWKAKILEDVAALAESNGSSSKKNLPTPAKAVRELLRKHPKGLVAKEVIEYLVDHIQTSSDNQYKLLYSTLATLKRNKKIAQDNDGRYRLVALLD